MRTIKHWTPRYIFDRLHQIAYQWRYPDSPWLTELMVNILGSWLRPGDSGLEWGSRRSTLWFAKRVDRLLSIEHDEYWHRRISSQILQKAIHNVEYRLCLKDSEY